MFVEYTESEVQRLHQALKSKKEISLKKIVHQKVIDAKYHDLSENNKKLVQIIKKVKLFANLDERLVLEIIKMPQFIHYTKADVVIDKNITSKSIFYILNGSCKKIYYDSKGHLLNSVFMTSEIFNEAVALTNIKEKKIVYANEDNTTIFSFLLNESLQNNPKFSYIYSEIYKRIAISMAQKFLHH